MKKGSSFLFISLLILTGILVSCKVSVEDSHLSRKPDIDLSEKQVTLIIHKINSDTDYINVYRKETSKSDAPELCIGIVYPQKTDEITYRFIDTLVHEDTKYTYKVRYHDKSGYQYSEWSNEIDIEDFVNAYSFDKKLEYVASSDSRFIFDKTDYTLKITGTITSPEIRGFDSYILPSGVPDTVENRLYSYQPMLILSYEDVKQVFKISRNSISNSEPITLRDRIPLSFMDKPIKVEGILAQKIEYVNPEETDQDKLTPKIIRWTAPTYIKVMGHGDNEIKIPSSAEAAGYDYSRRIK